jgi:predicted nucleic acid-binding protein
LNVLIDTTIWSLALRRRKTDLSANDARLVARWGELVQHGQAILIGPIRQEVLSGVRDARAFARLQVHLSGFRVAGIRPRDYDEAAKLYNTCRAHGIAGSSIDMLICAVASRMNLPLFTTDTDFERYARWIGLRLFDA